jgi:uncharacterized protein (DUF433 family)
MTTVAYAHIEFAADGTPYIAGTMTKVQEVVLDLIAHGWDAAEIHRQHPHLTRAEIHSALAYYYDHRTEIEASIEEGLHQVKAIRASLPPSIFQSKLRAQGLLP